MDPAAISSGIGQGMAQIFEPTKDYLDEAMKAAKTQKEEKEKRKTAALKAAGELGEFHVWTERDGKAFAEKQKAIWDEFKTKDLSDPETILWLNQKKQELTYLADQSNEDREYFKRDTGKVAEDPSKHYSDAVSNLLAFADPSNALGAKTKYDPNWTAKRADWYGDIGKMKTSAKAWAEANKKEEPRVGTIPGSSQKFKIETTTTAYPLEKAKNDLRTYVGNLNNLRTATEIWKESDKTGKYKDVYEWMDAEIAPDIASSSKDVDVSQLSTGGGGGGGAALPYGGWSAKLTATEVPGLSEAGIKSAVNRIKNDPQSNAKREAEYNLLLKGKKIPQDTEKGEPLTDDKGEPIYMNYDQWLEDQVRKSPPAQKKDEGAVYHIGRASKAGEASEIRYMDILMDGKQGIKFRPTEVIIRKGREPILSGLDDQENVVEIPYSKIVGKLKVETQDNWNYMKQQIIDEQGFDPFARYEPKSGGAKATTEKRDASGNVYEESQPVAPIQGKTTGSVLKDYAPDVQERIKAVMAANNIDEKTAIQALKDAKKIK